MGDHAFCALPLKREQNTMSRDKLSFSEATVFLQILREMLPPSGQKCNKQSTQPCHPAGLFSFPWVKEEFCFGFLYFLSLCLHNIGIILKKKIKPL